jgi:hypothetical protein
MNNGLSRFTFYTEQIKVLLNKARVLKNPGMWLFKNNARTPFFMLEGLAKIYADMHNTKKSGKLKEHFKLIEDSLTAFLLLHKNYFLALSRVIAQLGNLKDAGLLLTGFPACLQLYPVAYPFLTMPFWSRFMNPFPGFYLFRFTSGFSFSFFGLFCFRTLNRFVGFILRKPIN